MRVGRAMAGAEGMVAVQETEGRETVVEMGKVAGVMAVGVRVKAVWEMVVGDLVMETLVVGLAVEAQEVVVVEGTVVVAVEKAVAAMVVVVLGAGAVEVKAVMAKETVAAAMVVGVKEAGAVEVMVGVAVARVEVELVVEGTVVGVVAGMEVVKVEEQWGWGHWERLQ